MLHVHRAERADTLAEALGDVLASPQEDAFAAEVIAVPARGVERWLSQRLSHRLGAGAGRADGVCAGIEFPSPGRLVAEAAGAAAGVDPEQDPWRPERAVWPLLEVLDAGVDEEWAAPLRAHVRAGEHGRRYATARRIADLFADYAVHRPELLTAWLDGAGVPGERAADLGWQPELWRRLRDRIGEQSPAERLAAACAELRRRPEVATLPPRISLFGPTRLPAGHLAVLGALAEHREVHVWLTHPSPALWRAITAERAGVPLRRADPTAPVPRNPLLGSLGRDVRELQLRLTAIATDLGSALADTHHPRPDPPATLLGRLQADMRDDRPPHGGHVLAAGDRSVQVHSCHGPHRQVEVLREVLLGLLESDPTLEPRDVLVMCPDIETFAPLVSASFGLGSADHAADDATLDGHPGQHLRVRLADRALRQVNPLLDTVAQLLELAGSRLTAAQVLDLLGSGPVRRRFRLDDADLERLRDLVVRSGVRWGLDAPHRGPFQLDGFAQNTWSAGLDRLLLGVTMAGDGADGGPAWLGTALPMEDVESGDVERVGRLAEFVDRLAGVLAGLTGARPLEQWVKTLLTGLDVLTEAPGGRGAGGDEWQDAQARAELAEAALAAGPHAAAVPLELADVRGLLAQRLRGRPTRANFRTGTLTFATLVPMRSVPHRVVCLLGLDDGVFPRAGVPDGDDLLARDPLVGERDPRSEDRQLLLDAICAATEHLVVVHSGADERTGSRRPPAVPLGELLDAIEATAGPAARERVVVRHPLQPFDARNFVAGALAPGSGPFSFDRAELAGARAATGSKTPPAPFVSAPLAPVDTDVVALDDLVAFLEHPVKEFLRQRVGLSLFAGDADPADSLPVDLDGLAVWSIGDRLLRDRLAGLPLDRCRQAEWRRGELPPGSLGDAVLAGVLDDVEPLVAAAAPYRTDDAVDLDLDVPLPGGDRVVGTLGGLHGQVLLRVEFSRLAPKQRIRAWARLLALTAATGERWRAVSIGRGLRYGLSVATAGPVSAEHATATLAELVALYRAGMREPLPLPTQAAHTYATTRRGGAEAAVALEEALCKWTGNGSGAERADDAHVRVWGPGAGPEVLTVPGEPGGEPTRFGSLAMRLWSPLLTAEDVVRL